MPHVIPTAADVKARFPEFATVVDPIVTTFISAAANEVDPSRWSEKYYKVAIMYLAAHYMWLYQQQLLIQANASGGIGGGGGAGSEVQTFLNSMSWEDFQIGFGSTRTNSGGTNMSWAQSSGGAIPLYGKTMYGQLYIELRQRNLPSVVLIG
jgi:Protein of unknown function (DUF4054)